MQSSSQKEKNYRLAAIGVAAVPFATSLIPVARAADTCADGAGLRSGINCAPADQKTKSVETGINTTVNTLLFAIGVASVIMIIIGGFRYVFSGGDPKNTTAAKDTILYASIGIVVALLAYAIVNFVLKQFGA